jgi:hypothetical protein
MFDEIPHGNVAVDVGRRHGSKVDHRGVDTPATLATPYLIKAHVTGDAQNPAPDLVVGRKTVE